MRPPKLAAIVTCPPLDLATFLGVDFLHSACVPPTSGLSAPLCTRNGTCHPPPPKGKWRSRLLRPRLSRIEVSIPLPTPCHYQDAAGAAAGALPLPQITLPPFQANAWQIARHATGRRAFARLQTPSARVSKHVGTATGVSKHRWLRRGGCGHTPPKHHSGCLGQQGLWAHHLPPPSSTAVASSTTLIHRCRLLRRHQLSLRDGLLFRIVASNAPDFLPQHPCCRHNGC